MYRILWYVAAFTIMATLAENVENGKAKETDRNQRDSQAVASNEQTDNLEKLYAEYHESFITREAAEEMRLRLRDSKKSDDDDDDYDEVLQELLQKSKPKDHKKAIYDKKYFDYLPSEEAEKHKYPKEESATSSLEISKSEEDSLKSTEGRRINSRRFRRNVPGNQGHQNREKRHFYQLSHQQPYDAIFQEPYHYYVPAASHQYRPQYVSVPAIQSIAYIWQPEYSNPNSFRPQQAYQPGQSYLPPNSVAQNRPYPPQNPPSSNTDGYLPPNKPGPMYLPPVGGIQNKFGGDEDNNRNFFIFDQVVDPTRLKDYSNRRPQTRPQNFGNPNSIPNNQRTTPRPTTTSTFPPLIHNSDNKQEFDWDAYMPAQQGQGRPSRPNNDRNTERPTTTSTFPPLIHNSDGNTFDWDAWEESKAQGNNNLDQNVDVSVRPLEKPRTTQRPQQDEYLPPPRQSRPLQRKGPSQCVFAIANCCSRKMANEIKYSCFERLGCNGAFWDINPCSQEMIDAATDEIERYS